MQSSRAIAAERSRDWAARIHDGDPAAESELIRHYARAVRLLLLGKTGQPSLANDLSQDTFIVVLRRMRAGELDKPESLSAFIRQVAINTSIDYFRREKRYVQQDEEMISLHASPGHHADSELDLASARKMLDSMLDELAIDRDRDLLRRFYLFDEDKGRICSDLNLSPVHFDRVLYRAKQRMRKLVDEKGLRTLLFGSLLDG